MKKTLLYLPGLGGTRTTERQRRYLKHRLKHTDTNLAFFDPKWDTDESYDQKWSRLQESADTFAHKLTTFRPIFDEVVLLTDMKVPGARKKRIPLVGHLLSIAYYLAIKLPI